MREKDCKEDVWESGSWRSHQCSRKAVKDGYCKQHHPEAVEERKVKSDAKYEARQKQSASYKLKLARKANSDLLASLEEATEALECAGVYLLAKKYREVIEVAKSYGETP